MTIAQNPILRGFYPDPSICRVGEDYYLVNSTFSYVPGVPIFHSRDLAHWEQIGNVLERKSQLLLDGATMSRGIFAPSIRYHKGLFYMITTNVSHGGNFYVTAQNPAGPWSDPIYLAPPKDADGGIDPSLYFEGDKCYYIGQRQKRNAKWYGDCEIWLQELDLEKGELVGEDYTLYDGSMKDAKWAEGPHLYKVGEYYYVTCAEQGTAYEHSISVARSKKMTGPYENCLCNPIVTHRHLGRQYPIQCIGHGDLVDTPDGKWYMVALGTRPINGVTELGRETFLAEVTWQEGWPVVNVGEGKLLWEQPVDLPEVMMDKADFPAWQECMEMKFTDPLDKRFIFFRHPDEDTYKIVSEEEVALKCADAKPENAQGIISYMGIRQQDRSFSVQAQVSVDESGDCEAGLLYLHSDENYLKLVLTRQGDSLKVVALKRELANDEVLGEIAASEACANLEIRGESQRVTLYADGKEICSDISVEFLSSERAEGFIGCTYGIYAYGDGSTYANFKNLVIKYPQNNAIHV